MVLDRAADRGALTQDTPREAGGRHEEDQDVDMIVVDIEQTVEDPWITGIPWENDPRVWTGGLTETMPIKVWAPQE